MTRIVVDPEHLQALASLLRRHVDDMRATSDQLNGMVNGLSPQEAQQYNITGTWEQARLLVRNLANQAEGSASSLALKARNLQDADRDGAAQMQRFFTDFQAVLSHAPGGWQMNSYTPPVPQDLIGRVSGLGGSGEVILPVAAVAGLAALVGVTVATKHRTADGATASGNRQQTTPDSAPVTGSPSQDWSLMGKGVESVG